MKVGSEEAEMAVSDVITEDTKKYMKCFEEKVGQVNQFTNNSIKDYDNVNNKLTGDLKTLGSRNFTE